VKLKIQEKNIRYAEYKIDENKFKYHKKLYDYRHRGNENDIPQIKMIGIDPSKKKVNL